MNDARKTEVGELGGDLIPEPDAEATPAAEAGAEPQAPPLPAAGGEVETASELRDRWLRAEANLQNYRRRAQRDLEEGRRFAEEQVLLEMISMLDDLERAIEAAREASAPDAWLQGVTLVASRMRDYLARQGVLPMDPLGERFDPEFHEALLEVDAPPGTTPGQVVQVARRGYRRDGRALRAARVVVARHATDES